MNSKISIFTILLILLTDIGYGASVSVEGVSKIRGSKGYTFTINYQTSDEWTDGVIFKIFCKFNRREGIVFSSGGLNNIKKGWHKVTVNIPKVYRERYGPIVDYRIELYHKGILAALRGM